MSNTKLSNFILSLENNTYKLQWKTHVKNPTLFIKSLKSLHKMIGGNELKSAVVDQVTLFIKNKIKKKKGLKINDIMTNCLLYGSPGVGKTTFATKIGMIIYSMGYLDDIKYKKKQNSFSLLSEKIQSTMDSYGISSSMLVGASLVIISLFGVMLTKIKTMMQSTKIDKNSEISLSEEEKLKIENRKKNIKYMTILFFIIIVIMLLIFYYIYSNISVSENTNNEEIKLNENEVVLICHRNDFVGQYVGWSEKKTIEFLESNRGKILIVDEAYALVNRYDDSFGIEILTAINTFMSENPSSIIFIFTGYKEKMEETIFSVQPGLKRRFMWNWNWEH